MIVKVTKFSLPPTVQTLPTPLNGIFDVFWNFLAQFIKIEGEDEELPENWPILELLKIKYLNILHFSLNILQFWLK